MCLRLLVCCVSRLLCLALLCSAPWLAHAEGAGPVELFNGDYYAVTDRVHVLHDPENVMSIEDVMSAEAARQ